MNASKTVSYQWQTLTGKMAMSFDSVPSAEKWYEEMDKQEKNRKYLSLLTLRKVTTTVEVEDV